MITFQDVKENQAIQTYIQKADESLTALGYTEHSFAHVSHVAAVSRYILLTMGYSEQAYLPKGVKKNKQIPSNHQYHSL